MDRNWMYGRRNTIEYLQGVEEFISYAEDNQIKTGEDFMSCPCCDCKNLRKFRNSGQVKSHLIRRGFKAGYNRWIWHGENLPPNTSTSDIGVDNDEVNNEINVDSDDNNEENDRLDEMMCDIGEDCDKMPRGFESLFVDAEKPLYTGCNKFTKLSGVLKLYNLKAKNGWSDRSFTGLLELLSDMLPDNNELPRSTYEAKVRLLIINYVEYILESNSCRLAVSPFGDRLSIVARGMAYPIRPSTLVHSQSLLFDHIKVSVDEVVAGAVDIPLPVRTQHHTSVGEGMGSFVQWPMRLVLIGDDEVNVVKACNGADVCETTIRKPLVDEKTYFSLGEDCRLLHDLVLAMPFGVDYIEVAVDENIFHHSNMKGIYLTSDAISDFLKMNWLDVPIIQVFIMFLYELCNEDGLIGFLCPTQYATASLKNNVGGTTRYLSNIIHNMMEKTPKRYILAPYNQDNHWMLLVICPSTYPYIVYKLDSMERKRDLDIKPVLNIALKAVGKTQGKGGLVQVDWETITCPQQPGGNECGYYVMKYMYDICTKYKEHTSLGKVFQNVGRQRYSNEEIDEICMLWAKFCKMCL